VISIGNAIKKLESVINYQTASHMTEVFKAIKAMFFIAIADNTANEKQLMRMTIANMSKLLSAQLILDLADELASLLPLYHVRSKNVY